MDVTYTISEVDEVAKQLIDNARTKTLLFYGDMGVGKTTLIKALVKTLGSADDVNSPTFSIVNEYITKNDSVYHFDFYRIKNTEEAYNFGIEEYLYSNNWVFIEWPEILPEILPEEADKIYLKLNPDGSRKLILKN